MRRHCEKLALGVPNCHVQEQLLARCNSYLNLIDVPKRPLGPCMDLIALSMRFAVFVLVFRIVAVRMNARERDGECTAVGGNFNKLAFVVVFVNFLF